MQFGIGAPQGAIHLTHSVQNYVKEHPVCVAAQLDLSNAFGSVDRQAALDSLYSVSQNKTRYIAKWLQHAQYGCLNLPTEERTLLETTSGLPQGDPMSATTFCVTVTQANQRALPTPPADEQALQGDTQAKAWLYVDDITLACSRSELIQVMAHIRQELQKIGNSLKRFWPFSESVDSKKSKFSALISFPNLGS